MKALWRNCMTGDEMMAEERPGQEWGAVINDRRRKGNTYRPYTDRRLPTDWRQSANRQLSEAAATITELERYR